MFPARTSLMMVSGVGPVGVFFAIYNIGIEKTFFLDCQYHYNDQMTDWGLEIGYQRRKEMLQTSFLQHLLLEFNPNWPLDPEQISLDC